MTALAPVFASTFLYSACKVVGTDAWPAYLNHRLKRVAIGDNLGFEKWAGFRTLGQLSNVCTFDAFVDASTYIDRARCVAAGHFLESKHDVWVTFDDDIDAHADELRKLVRAARATRGGVAVPYMNRDGRSMTFRKVCGPTEYPEPDLPLRPVDRVGFGLVALHRELVETLASRVVDFRESDRAATRCPLLFRNGVEEGTWMGEDYYFSKLAEDAGAPLRVLLDAPAAHAGLLAKLSTDGAILVADSQRGRVLDAALRARESGLPDEPPTAACGKPKSQGG